MANLLIVAVIGLQLTILNAMVMSFSVMEGRA